MWVTAGHRHLLRKERDCGKGVTDLGMRTSACKALINRVFLDSKKRTDVTRKQDKWSNSVLPVYDLLQHVSHLKLKSN